MTDTPRLTAAEIEALAQQVAKMTDGPWETRFFHRIFESARRDQDLLFGVPPEQDWTDCDGIVALRNAAPALIAAARTLVKMQDAPKRKYKKRPPPPDIEIRCDCGAVWRGRHAVDNSVIEDHRARERNGRKAGCCVHPPTHPKAELEAALMARATAETE